MKKRLIALALIAALGVGTIPVWAACGSADDPVLSLSYLKSTVKPQLTQSLRGTLFASSGSGTKAAAQVTAEQTRYKEGDALTAKTGSELLVLAGTVSVSFPGGAVVNATAGSETPFGTALSVNSRYIVGEDTSAVFTVTSPTAVVSCTGAVTCAPSSKPDYNAMADALHSPSLLAGTGTGFGSGYDLEKQPTRIEAIVMFIRLLGEENAALACKDSHPFTDVPAWADRYVAYAYAKGYSNGAGGRQFASTRVITAKEYVEFVMRALRYSSTAHTDLSTTLSVAKSDGLLNAAEYDLLNRNALLRAHLVYLSYYALTTPVSGSTNTLEQQLAAQGVFSQSALTAAHAMVTTARLGT